MDRLGFVTAARFSCRVDSMDSRRGKASLGADGGRGVRVAGCRTQRWLRGGHTRLPETP